MNLRPRRSEDPEISLTPLIDVIFIILIFFVITTTFVPESGLEIRLPEADVTPSAERPDTLELAIDADGQYFLEGKPLVNSQPVTVRRALEEKVAAGDRRPLTIRADGRTPHQAVVAALDAAGQVGIKQISIATVPPEQSAP